MKRLLTLFLFLISLPAFSATITAAAGGGNWSNTATWVGAATPTAADDVVLAITSGSVTVDVGTALAKSVTATAFTNNLNFSAGQTLTVSGNVQFNSLAGGMTILGTGILGINATSNILSAGQTFTGSLFFNANATYTLGDNWTITGSFINGSTTGTFNGNVMNVGGSFTLTANIAGTTKFNLNGSGTWSGVGALASGVTINTSGSITLANGNISSTTGNINYTAGTVVNTGNTLLLSGATTFNTGTMHWNNIQSSQTANQTHTLSSALILDGTLLLPQEQTSQLTTTFSGAFPITTNNLSIMANQMLKLTAGQTITVSGTMLLPGNANGASRLQSATGSSSIFLKYTGSCQNNLVFFAALTDVDATPSTSPVTIWGAGTITRTTNIVNNGTYPPSCGGSSRGFIF